jgi:hypothetical protein
MTAALFSTLALFLLAVAAPLVHGGPSCLDEAGNAVDSWTALKQANSFNVYVQSGSSFVKSKYMLNQTSNGAVMRTAKQLYSLSSSSAYAVALYNDEPPLKSASSVYAHAKGMLLTDATSGFWFIHSMPLWPANITANKDPGPFPSDTYAQSITCITISAATANTIAAGKPRATSAALVGPVSVPTLRSPKLAVVRFGTAMTYSWIIATSAGRWCPRSDRPAP